jgi:WD40 repeat protein
MLDYASQKLLSASKDKTLVVWDIFSGDIIHTFKRNESYILASQFSPHGDGILAINDNSIIKAWETVTGALKCTFKHYTDNISIACFDKTGTYAATVHSVDIMIYVITTGRLACKLQGHSDTISSITFNSSGTQLASASTEIKLWNAVSGECIRTIGNNHTLVYCIKFSIDDKNILSGDSENKKIKVWPL